MDNGAGEKNEAPDNDGSMLTTTHMVNKTTEVGGHYFLVSRRKIRERMT